MEHEFPTLTYDKYQAEFLRDWWSPKKLFRGGRGSGKTTMMLCEARRFQDAGFRTLFFTYANPQLVEDMYFDLFGERTLKNVYSSGNLSKIRGVKYDVVIIDEINRISESDYMHNIEPIDPIYLRASEDIISDTQYPEFDAVYQSTH